MILKTKRLSCLPIGLGVVRLLIWATTCDSNSPQSTAVADAIEVADATQKGDVADTPEPTPSGSDLDFRLRDSTLG